MRRVGVKLLFFLIADDVLTRPVYLSYELLLVLCNLLMFVGMRRSVVHVGEPRYYIAL